jgi:hypothetical protein
MHKRFLIVSSSNVLEVFFRSELGASLYFFLRAVAAAFRGADPLCVYVELVRFICLLTWVA